MARPAQGGAHLQQTFLSATSATTASWSVVAGEVLLVGVQTMYARRVTAISGFGLTWTSLGYAASVQGPTAQRGIEVFRAVADATISGTLSVTVDGTAQSIAVQAVRIAGADVDSIVSVSAYTSTLDENNDLAVSIDPPGTEPLIIAWANHRLAAFTVPSPQSLLADFDINTGGANATRTRGTLFSHASSDGSVTTMGGADSLSLAEDWVVLAVAISPPSGDVTGSGTSTIAGPSVDASGTQTFTGTGSATISGASAVGTGTANLDATGAVTISGPSTTGTGTAAQSVATVTVDQLTTGEVAQLRLAAYAVQRFLRGGGMTSAERTAALAVMAQGTDAIVYQWSGGYRNADSSLQMWAQHDFAPTSMATARSWTGTTSRRGLDQSFADLDDLIALRPGAKMVLVMHDFPEAMLAGDTRTSGQQINPWPAASQWGASFAGQLASDIIARYGASKILAFSYGQELKGFTSRTSTTELDAFAAGYTAFASYMRTNHPGVELWYPHVNYWATWGTLTSRRDAMDAIIAGGSTLHANDEIIINRLMDQVAPALVDRMTFDASIIDYSTTDTWRGDYAATVARVSMEFHLQRVLKEKMDARWGVRKPLVAIESYFDVHPTEQDWASEQQSAALQTAILMHALRGGVTYHARWEPQGGTPGAEAPDGNIASWWNQDGVAFAAWPQARDLVATIPPGTALHPVTSDDASIVAVAGGGKVYLLNTSGAAISTGVQGSSGALAAQSIAAYGYAVRDLPVVTGSYASDTYTRTIATGNSLGTSDSGHSYTLSTSSSVYGVDGARGYMNCGAGNTRAAFLAGLSRTDMDVTVTVQTDKRAVGDISWLALTVRQTTILNDMVQVEIKDPTGTARPVLTLLKRVANAQSTLAGPLSLDSAHGHDEGVFSAAADYRIRVQAEGTTYRARAWKVGNAEPTHWCVSGTAADAVLASGSVGYRAFNGSASTAGTIRWSVDDLSVGTAGTSGAVTIAGPTASGTGTQTFEASGAVTLSGPSVAGTGTAAESSTGTGSATISGPSTTGLAWLTFEGIGAATIAGPSTDGTGAIFVLPPPPPPRIITLRIALDTGHEPVARLVALWPDFTVRETWEGRAGPDGTPRKGAILLDGSVSCDRTREIRRTASFEVSNVTGSLSPKVLGDMFFSGSLVRIERGVRINGLAQYVTLFTGPVTTASPSMDGTLSVSAEDVLSRAQQQFGEVVVLDPEMPGEVIFETLLRSRLGSAGPAWQLDAGGRSLGVLRAIAEDDDVLGMAMTIARDLACELLAYRHGEVILRPAVDPSTLPVTRRHVVERGIADMHSLELQVSARPYNRAKVIGLVMDGPVVTGIAEITDPSHPLHPDRLGGIRQAPIRRSAQITHKDVADAAAQVDLYSYAFRDIGVGSVTLPDPTVDEGHVHEFVEPITGADDRWWLDTVGQPILAGTTSLSGRKTRSLFG